MGFIFKIYNISDPWVLIFKIYNISDLWVLIFKIYNCRFYNQSFFIILSGIFRTFKDTNVYDW